MFGAEQRGKEQQITVDSSIKMSLPLVLEALKGKGVELIAIDPENPDIPIPLKTDNEGHLQVKVGNSWLIAKDQKNYARLVLGKDSLDLVGKITGERHKEMKKAQKGQFLRQLQEGPRKAAPAAPEEKAVPLVLSDKERASVKKFLDSFVYGTELFSEKSREILEQVVWQKKGPWMDVEDITSISDNSLGVNIETRKGTYFYSY